MVKIKFIVGILISILFLHLALRNINFSVVAVSFKNIEFTYLALCILSQFASLSCRAYLWKNILWYEKEVQYSHSFEALLIGYMGNNILPFRMGEAMRAFTMGKKESMSRTLAFASIILERLMDLFVLLAFFLTLIFLVRLERWIMLSGIVVLLLLLFMIIILFALASDFLKIPSRLYHSMIHYLPGSLIETIERIGGSFLKGIKLIKNFKQALYLVFLSFLTWILWTAILYFGLKAFHLDLPIIASLLLAVVVNIGVMIPSSPGFIGVFQYLCIISLAFFNIPKEIALSFSFLVHTVQYIPTTALGWFYLTRMQIHSYQALRKELRQIPLS
jgi:uncharacterized protein (TIRG00374 family)